MLVGHGGSFELNLFFLQAWSDHEELFHTLKQIVDKHGLILLNKKYTVLEKRQVGLAPEAADFIKFCRAEYRGDVSFPKQTADKLTIKMRPKFVLNADKLLPAHQDVIILLGAFRHRDGFGQIWFSAEMSSRMSDYSKNPLYGDQVMALFAGIAERFATEMPPDFRPDYGWAAETDDNMDKMPKEQIQAKRPSRRFWGNYFGDGFLEAHQRTLFAESPIGRTKQLAQGMWYQLDERFEDAPGQDATQIVAAAEQYFAPMAFELVQWRFEAA